MSTLTIRLPDAKHERLKTLACSRGVSVNKLVEEWGHGNRVHRKLLISMGADGLEPPTFAV